MKKIITFILAALMLLSLCACASNSHSDDIAIIGGADGPTAIIIADNGSEKELPAEITHEYIYNDDEHCTYYIEVEAISKEGHVLWEHLSPNCFVGQLENLEYLGEKNGIVYINENGICDEEKMQNDDYTPESHLLALDAYDGSVVWENTDYKGASSSLAFDEEGNIYIGGYFGPDCMKISRTGETLWTVESVGSDHYWMSGVSYENGEVTLTYDSSEESVKISADGEIIK